MREFSFLTLKHRALIVESVFSIFIPWLPLHEFFPAVFAVQVVFVQPTWCIPKLNNLPDFFLHFNQ